MLHRPDHVTGDVIRHGIEVDCPTAHDLPYRHAGDKRRRIPGFEGNQLIRPGLIVVIDFRPVECDAHVLSRYRKRLRGRHVSHGEVWASQTAGGTIGWASVAAAEQQQRRTSSRTGGQQPPSGRHIDLPVSVSRSRADPQAAKHRRQNACPSGRPLCVAARTSMVAMAGVAPSADTMAPLPGSPLGRGGHGYAGEEVESGSRNSAALMPYCFIFRCSVL